MVLQTMVDQTSRIGYFLGIYMLEKTPFPPPLLLGYYLLSYHEDYGQI